MIIDNEKVQHAQKCMDTICNSRDGKAKLSSLSQREEKAKLCSLSSRDGKAKLSSLSQRDTQEISNKLPRQPQPINEEREIRLYEKNLPIFILTSRFNNYYWNINKTFRNDNAIKCIYGSPIEISNKIEYNKKCFVLEMNNDTNKIMGIGFIVNYPHYNKYKIYGDRNDRYVYKSNKWISLLPHPPSNEINKDLSLMIEVLEQLCFYGNEHLKRGNGLKCFPIKYLYRLEPHLNILKILIDIFDTI